MTKVKPSLAHKLALGQARRMFKKKLEKHGYDCTMFIIQKEGDDLTSYRLERGNDEPIETKAELPTSSITMFESSLYDYFESPIDSTTMIFNFDDEKVVINVESNGELTEIEI